MDDSFSPLRGLVRQLQSVTRLYSSVLIWFSFENIHNHGKKCTDGTLLDQFYTLEFLKGFIWPKNYCKLSKDDKLTVKKKDVH